MIKKAIGTIFVIVGGTLIVLLLTYGGPIFPHIIGPTALTAVGVALVAIKGKGNKSAE
jgi:hypothetical protein